LSVRDVPWDVFRFYAGTDDEKFSSDWLLNPANVVSSFRDGNYCRLCDSDFTVIAPSTLPPTSRACAPGRSSAGSIVVAQPPAGSVKS